MKNIRRIFSYIADERARLIWTALLSAGLSVANIINPLVFRYVIDQLTQLSSHPASSIAGTITAAIGILIAVQIVSSIFDFFRERLSDRMYVSIYAKLSQRIFEHMMSLSIDYYEQTKVGETMTKVQNALLMFSNWLTNLTQGALSTLIQLILALALLWYIDPLIGPIVAVLMLAGIAIQVIRIRRARELWRESRKQYEKVGGHLNETISHITTIRSSVPASVPIGKNAELLTEAQRLNTLQNNVEQYGNLARSLVGDVAIIAAVAIVAWQSLHGQATAGDVVAVALYLQQITSGVGPIGRLIVNTYQVETSVERITELLETTPTVIDAPGAEQLSELRSIEFQNISFCYPGKRRKVLDSVSFRLEADQTLALVGPSGTGKTTITKLMLRFYEPSGGTILINNLPVERFTAESIRQQIGMVMQDVALFNDSVQANIQLANPSASTAKVREAAAQAHADVFINKLPDRYKTLVGERGVKLSGGEKQRVAIARAILKDPDMIILDEATSALDSESERHVQAGLNELMAKRSAVVIAHRLSTVMRADKILVLRNGKVVESGRHEDLAAKSGGLYAKLFKMQTEGYAAAA